MDGPLIIFLAINFLNVAGIHLDLILWTRGLPTITHMVRTTPILGLPILGIQVIAFLALALHFYGKRF